MFLITTVCTATAKIGQKFVTNATETDGHLWFYVGFSFFLEIYWN